jgi:cytochrome c5
MSDKNHDQAHEDHTGPVKTPKQMLLLSFFSFVVPIFLIIGLVFYVSSANKQAPGAEDAEKAVAMRIQKIGAVEVRDANRPLKSGEEVYKAQCAACHATGAAGAPKFGDAGAWGPRIKTGFASLMNSALKGKGAMATFWLLPDLHEGGGGGGGGDGSSTTEAAPPWQQVSGAPLGLGSSARSPRDASARGLTR